MVKLNQTLLTEEAEHMDVTINSYPSRSSATPLTIITPDDSLTIFEARCYDNEWSGDGVINWGEDDIGMNFRIVNNVCSIYVTGEAHEGSEPLRAYIYSDTELCNLTELELYSILTAAS